MDVSFIMSEKEKKEMKIKEFCKEYSNRIDKLKGDYLKENLKITTYLPFIKKDALAQNIVNATTYKFEDYTKEDGTTGRRRTNQIQVNSTAQMLLFYRVIIENYTDLEVETEGFYEEYDALNESGVLFELTADFDGHPSLIPAKEISELRGMVDLKQRDIMTNQYEMHSYISNQIERITEVGSVVLKPVLDKLATELENMDDSKIEKLSKALECGLKRIK